MPLCNLMILLSPWLPIFDEEFSYLLQRMGVIRGGNMDLKGISSFKPQKFSVLFVTSM